MRIQRSHARCLTRALSSVTDVDGTAQSLCAVAEVISAACPGLEPRSDVQAMPCADVPEGARVDNRHLWGMALARGDCLGEVAHVVRWYMAVLDNTGVVERDLGALLRSHHQHIGASAEVTSDVLLLFWGRTS